MTYDAIFAWLKIPTRTWPPDHYTLLGLRPGEADLAKIERHVELRMEQVRCYQLAQPELATAAMNRLAQAFDCLRNPEARKAYDAQLKGPPPVQRGTQAALTPSVRPIEIVPASKATAELAPPTLGNARLADPAAPTPPPIREAVVARPDKTTAQITRPALVNVESAAPPQAPDTDLAAAPTAPPSTVEEPPDPALEAARSGLARRRLGTKRAVYQRISRTRQLIRAWVQAGKYLGDTRYQLSQKPEAIDLVRQLTIIRQQLLDFPPLLGQAGQPGYLVIALARQPEIVKTFQSLSPSQRKSYVRDWQAGLTFLAAYRLFLREELWKLRRQTRFGRLLRAVGSLFTDFPVLWLIVLAVVALNLAFPICLQVWHVQVLAGVAVLFLLFLSQNLARNRSLHRRRKIKGVGNTG